MEIRNTETPRNTRTRIQAIVLALVASFFSTGCSLIPADYTLDHHLRGDINAGFDIDDNGSIDLNTNHQFGVENGEITDYALRIRELEEMLERLEARLADEEEDEPEEEEPADDEDAVEDQETSAETPDEETLAAGTGEDDGELHDESGALTEGDDADGDNQNDEENTEENAEEETSDEEG